MRRADGSAGLLGLARCSSVWACPCCAPGIAAERAAELGALVAWGYEARRARTYMLSLTVRHAWSDEFAVTLRGVANAWRRFVSGAPWQKWKAAVGLVGYVRGVEATHGPNGWHPHAHVLFLVRDPLALESSWEWLAERWQACVARELGTAYEPDLIHGCNLKSAAAADYIVKLGLELTSIGTKTGTGPNRTPWEIATDAVGDARSLALWREYVEATHGHRQLTWSVGLRAAAGLVEDEAAAELAEHEAEGSEVLAELAPLLWDEARRRHMEPALLDAAERGAERVASVLVELRRLGGFPLHRARDPGT